MYHTRLSKLKLSEDLSSRGSSLKLGDPSSRAIKGGLLSVELEVGRKNLYCQVGGGGLNKTTYPRNCTVAMEHPENNKITVGENQFFTPNCRDTVG